jgi:hypothetical protein
MQRRRAWPAGRRDAAAGGGGGLGVLAVAGVAHALLLGAELLLRLAELADDPGGGVARLADAVAAERLHERVVAREHHLRVDALAGAVARHLADDVLVAAEELARARASCGASASFTGKPDCSRALVTSCFGRTYRSRYVNSDCMRLRTASAACTPALLLGAAEDGHDDRAARSGRGCRAAAAPSCSGRRRPRTGG